MLLAADYPFFDIFWTIVIFFAWIAWFSTVIRVLADIFSRSDMTGWGKAGWVLLVAVVPFLGVLIYLGTQGHHIHERQLAQANAQKAQFDDYVRGVAGGGSAAEIASAKSLLDSGAIDQAEFDRLKAKALA